MEDSRVNSLIREFCNYLREYIPEFQELAAARNALNENKEAKKLWDEKEERRETIELLKAKGLPVSEEQEKEFNQKLTEIRENAVTTRYAKAKNFARKIAKLIGNELGDDMGVDFTPGKPCK